LATKEIGLVRPDTLGRDTLDGLPLLGEELDPESLHDAVCDLVLDLEHADEVAIESLSPDMTAGSGVDQLCGDPDTFSGLAHTPLEEMPDAELFADLLGVDRLPLVQE
jgi:hypothetical protein